MVQVDVFWSYGIGAGFALAAANQLRADRADQPSAAPTADQPNAEPKADQSSADQPHARRPDPYLTATIVYAAAVFAPSGAWLLWQFPSWETMHAGSHETVPGWLVALFTATNTTQAIVGFLATRWLVERGRHRTACLQLVGAYFAMFFILVHGWDGTGYRRFFSATAADLANWGGADPLQHVRAWLTSDVALTLYGMGVVLVPLLLGLCVRWHVAANPGGGARVLALALAGIFGLGLGGAIVASVLVHLLGWLAGAAVFALVAAAVVAPPRGPVTFAANRLVRGAARPATPELV